MYNLQKLKLVKQAVENLLQVKGTVTALNVKNELRKKFPKEEWHQKDISEAIEYFSKKTQTKQLTPKTPRAKKVSRTTVLSLMQKSGGRFFGVTFTKKDGTIRKMNVKLNTHHSKPTNLGYLLVFDSADKNYKSLNLQTLSEVRIDKQVYSVN